MKLVRYIKKNNYNDTTGVEPNVYYLGRIKPHGRKDATIFTPIFHISGRYTNVRTSIGCVQFPDEWHGRKFRLRVEFLDESEQLNNEGYFI